MEVIISFKLHMVETAFFEVVLTFLFHSVFEWNNFNKIILFCSLLLFTYPTQLTQLSANANNTKADSGAVRFIFTSSIVPTKYILISKNDYAKLKLCILQRYQILNWLIYS